MREIRGDEGNSAKSSRVSVCAVGPGWCRTRMGGEDAPRSAEQGAASILWATAHRQSCNGQFLLDGEPVEW